MRKTALAAIVAAAGLAAAGAAAAAPACTNQPQSKWLTEAQMRAKLAEQGYQVKVFQISGACYEIYGRNKAGQRAEVYFNPVDGSVVRANVDD